MIALPPKTHIWIAAGVTDLRRGFDGLSGKRPNQTAVTEQHECGQ
jgi:hypothetical protein